MQDKATAEPRTLRLNTRDNIIVAVDQVAQGARVNGVVATARVTRGHKMATSVIEKGKPVYK